MRPALAVHALAPVLLVAAAVCCVAAPNSSNLRLSTASTVRHLQQDGQQGTSARAVAAAGPQQTLQEFNQTCKKVLWVVGLQATTATGEASAFHSRGSHYILRYYVTALLSARKNAPSLVPVAVGTLDMPDDIVQELKTFGVTYISHNLSFADQLYKLKDDSKFSFTMALWGSYLRVAFPEYMDRLLAALPSRDGVDTDYILWTDLDVVFMKDIDSCLLPKPRLVSWTAEVDKDVPMNAGVMYFNVSAFRSVYKHVLDHGNQTQWRLWVFDQDVIQKFFYDLAPHVVSELPNMYNYKLFWGWPQKLSPWGRSAAEPIIIHTYGPKMDKALCAVKILRERNESRYSWDFSWDTKRAITEGCGWTATAKKRIEAVSVSLLMLGMAWKQDGCYMYEWAADYSNQLWLQHPTGRKIPDIELS